MKRTWVELTCDACGCADHYKPFDVIGQALQNGWIVTKNKKMHFCNKQCQREYNTRANKLCG